MHREYIRETKVYGAEANSMDREMAYSCCKFSCSDLKHTSASHTVELMTDIRLPTDHRSVLRVF